MRKTFVLLIMLSLALSAQATSNFLNYQGRLSTSDGGPVQNLVSITFTFYDSAAGGSQITTFSDSDLVTPDAAGIFSTLIGDDPDYEVPEEIFRTDEVWLNVNINGEDLRPRKKVTAVGFSMQTGNVRGGDVGRMHFVADGFIQAGDVVVLNDAGHILAAALTGVGDKTLFSSQFFHPLALEPLGNGKYLLLFMDVSYIPTVLYGCIVTVSGNTISSTIDNPVVLDSTSTGYVGSVNTCSISEGTVLVSYSAGIHTKLVVVSESGGSLSLGSPVALSSAEFDSGPNAPVFLLNPSTALTAYIGKSDAQRYARIIEIDGLNLSLGAIAGLGAAGNDGYTIGGVALDGDSCLFAFSNDTTNDYLIPVTWAEDTLSSGTAAAVPYGIRDSMVLFDPNKVLMTAYHVGLGIYQGAVVTVEGEALTVHDWQELPTDFGTPATCALGTDRVAYSVGENIYEIQANGTALTVSDPLPFSVPDRDYGSQLVHTGGGKVAIVFNENVGNATNYGLYGRVLHLGAAVPVDFTKRIGIAEESAAVGDKCLVTIPGGVSDQFSGLDPGVHYYVSEGGFDTTGEYRIGIAVSPTSLMVWP